MFTPQAYYSIYQEQHQDRMRELRRYQLLQAAGLQQDSLKLSRQAVGWFGTQMVNWGLKLQSYVAIKDTDKGCQESSLTISMMPKI